MPEIGVASGPVPFGALPPGRHECLRHGAEYSLSYGIEAQTSRLPRWHIVRNTG
jgi:hypothetical protein